MTGSSLDLYSSCWGLFILTENSLVCSNMYAYSDFICAVAVIRTPRILSACSCSAQKIHSVVVGLFCMIILPGVSAIVAIRNFSLLGSIQVPNINKYFANERSPSVCRRRCCCDSSTDVSVCRSTCIVVLFGKLQIIVLSSMYSTICWTNLIRFVISVHLSFTMCLRTIGPSVISMSFFMTALKLASISSIILNLSIYGRPFFNNIQCSECFHLSSAKP